MSREETSELRARLVRKSDAAWLLTNRKGEGQPVGRPREFWLPRSLMGRTTTLPGAAGEYPLVICQVPSWKISQDSLDEFCP